MSNEEAEKDTTKPSLNSLPSLIFVGLMVLLIGALAISAWTTHLFAEKGHDTFFEEHGAAIFGAPITALMSFFLVKLLQQDSGPIEFEGGGITFKGAAGEVVMWVLCFVATAGMIKALW